MDRKIIVLLICLLTTTQWVAGQTEDYVSNVSYEKGIYYTPSLIVDAWAGGGATIGIEKVFGNGLSLSAGTGLAMQWWYPNHPINTFAIAYLEGKYSFSKRKNSMFTGLRIQGDMLLFNEKNGKSYEEKYINFYPLVGLDHKIYSIWLAIGLSYQREAYHSSSSGGGSYKDPYQPYQYGTSKQTSFFELCVPSIAIGFVWHNSPKTHK